MAKRKLTDPFIRNHSNPDNRIEIPDAISNGLYLRITPTGHKSFVFRYRFGKAVKRYTIGSYPAVGLAKAREQAKELSYQVSSGIDPGEEKKKRKQQQAKVTFQELTEQYKKIHLPGLRDKTQEEYLRIINNELLPAFGKIPVADLSKAEIVDLLDKKAITDGSVTMSNRIRARLHSIYEFAIGRALAENNPVTSIKKRTDGERKRERYYSESEIRKLWKAFERQEEPSQSVLKMLMICGQRSTETQYMRWKDINNGIWSIPAELSKSNRAHDVPLSDMALDVINRIKPLTGKSEYIFRSPKMKDQPIGWIQRPIKNIKDGPEGVPDFRRHDLRRTVATYMAKLNIDRTVLGKILNHKGLAGDNQVTAIYDRHEYLEEKREALQKWADELKRILAEDK